MQNLGKCLGYVSEPCPNCGRVRVEAYSGGKHICEKCNWCIEDEEYFDWDRYDDEVTFADAWKELEEMMTAGAKKALKKGD